MKDLLDLLFDTAKSNIDVSQYVSEPNVYKNTGGNDLFGYPNEQFVRAAFFYSRHMENMNFDQATSILNQLKITMKIEEMGLLFKKSILKNVKSVPFLSKVRTIKEVIIKSYSAFLKISEVEVEDLLQKSDTIYTQKWKEIVPDEDNVSLEQLGIFYNSLPFPIGCNLSLLSENNLSLSFRYLPILLANANKAQRVFDFGGNSGLITSAMAGTLNLETCMLIEENKKMLDFARWRDALFQINNIRYVQESEVFDSIGSFENSFDLGICTEVLEHVYDVEKYVEIICRMLKKGGLLFFSASFGLYPTPSHLKKNIYYAGKEDWLMGKYNLERISLNFPLPLLQNQRVYIKK